MSKIQCIHYTQQINRGIFIVRRLANVIAKKIIGTEKIETTAVTAKTRGPLLDSGDVDMDISTFTNGMKMWPRHLLLMRL